jgi:hypothetical protein
VKITIISWKDERWSADKETLSGINEMIKKKSKPIKVKWKKTWEPTSLIDKCAIGFGWLVISPFVLSEIIIQGFIWLAKKIKRK